MNQQIPSLSQGLHRTDHVEEQQSLPEGLSEREKIQYDYGRQRDVSKVTFFPAKKAPGLNDLSGRLRVVVYCRVSTDGLSQATSFELQKSYYLQYNGPLVKTTLLKFIVNGFHPILTLAASRASRWRTASPSRLRSRLP